MNVSDSSFRVASLTSANAVEPVGRRAIVRRFSQMEIDSESKDTLVSMAHTESRNIPPAFSELSEPVIKKARYKAKKEPVPILRHPICQDVVEEYRRQEVSQTTALIDPSREASSSRTYYCSSSSSSSFSTGSRSESINYRVNSPSLAAHTTQAPAYSQGSTPLPFRIIELNPAPPIPESDNRFKLGRAYAWAHAFPSQYQHPVMTKLIEAVEHVSYATFIEKLHAATSDCANCLNSSDYIVLVEPQKSNQWVTEIALSMFEEMSVRKPECVIALENQWAEGFRSFLSHQIHTSSDKAYLPSNIVLFDDATYSGKQMSKYVHGIFQAYRELGIEQANIIVVCPYATDLGRARVLERGRSFGYSERLNVICQEQMKLLSQLFTKQERRALLSTFWPKEKVQFEREEQAIEIPLDQRRWSLRPSRGEWDLDEKSGAGPFTRTATYFQHKVANSVSFPLALVHGYIYDTEGKLVNGQLDHSVSPPIFTRNGKYEEFILIPETTPPYKV